jgi:hypothetical protein
MYENYHAYTYYRTMCSANMALNARTLLGGNW